MVPRMNYSGTFSRRFIALEIKRGLNRLVNL
jgi:hypothetical protein